MLRHIGPVPRVVLVGALTVLVVVLATASVKKGVKRGGEMDSIAYDYFDKGNFWLKIWNRQYVGDDSGDKAGEWPGGSGVTYVYFGNIWFGSLGTDNQIHVSGNFPYAQGGPEWDETGGVSESDILMSDESNWQNRPSYIEQVGDLDSYAWCNDNKATENGKIPIELEVHGMSWAAPGHSDWVVLDCTVTNDATSTIKECYVSLAYDNDVGGSLDYIDDLVGYEGNDTYDDYANPTVAGVPWDLGSQPDGIPDENDAVNFKSSNADKPLDMGEEGWTRMTSYMYDSGGDSRSTPGYVGLRTMGWMDDADPPGSLIEVSSTHSWDIMNDPSNDAYKYGYMIDEGTFEEIPTNAYDWRIDPVFGPFDLDAGKKVRWFLGIVMGGDLYDMRKNADQLYADFIGIDGLPGTDDDWQVVSPPASPRLVAVRGDNQVTLRWNPNYDVGKNTETDEDPRSGEVDFDGYIVWRSDIGYDSGWVPILWVDKKSDTGNVYYPWGWRVTNSDKSKQERIPKGPPPPGKDPEPGQSYSEPDLRQSPAVPIESLKASFPTASRQGPEIRVRKINNYYELVDGVDGNGVENKTLHNGTRYYYAVVAYDHGATDPFLAYPTSGGRNVNALSVIPLPAKAGDLDNVRVVPNPYKGSADWEEWTGSGARLGRIYFMNLPEKCTIRIYTVSGDLVRTLEHNDVVYGAEPWDLTGNAGVQVASGIYLYHVDAPGVGEKIGKFAVLIGQN